MAATETLTLAADAARPARAPARPAGRDRRPADRRGRRARRRGVALRRRARRGDRLRRARLARRPARPGHRPEPHLRRAASRRGRRLRRLGLARARARGDDAAPRERPRLLQLVPDRRSRSRSAIGDLDPTGATVVFEVVIDDYAEVWVDGELPHALGDTGGPVVGGFNAPNRVVLTRDARPGQTLPDRRVRHQRPDLRLAAQLHLDAHGDARLLRGRARAGRVGGAARGRGRPRRPIAAGRLAARARRRRLRVHRGPGVDARRRAALQLAEHERDLPLDAERRRSRSSAPRAATPASTSAATTSPARTGSRSTREGRLTICQHGNRRVIRVNPHGDTTVLADRYEGRRLNSPNDLVYRSDGTLFFTDPPFGLPGRLRRPGQGARLQRRLPRARRRRGRAADGRARRPERARVLARRALALRRQLGLRPHRRHALRPATTGEGSVFFDMTAPDAEDAIDGHQGRPRRQPLRLRPRRHLGALARGRAPRHAAHPRGAAQPRLGRRRRPRPSTSRR